jgi:hypothetical protein
VLYKFGALDVMQMKQQKYVFFPWLIVWVVWVVWAIESEGESLGTIKE